MKKIYDSKFALPYRNILYIIIGFAVMVLGYVLMAGGGSDDPNVFNMEMFSFRRTVLAPIVILAGMVEIIWAIMYIGKSKKEDK
ncbi:MAG: DUF3098 domain-containing protein [Bacteroidales bacterium]|nr:DUF3098 domain-containing protein [Bacteroidales bacterium]